MAWVLCDRGAALDTAGKTHCLLRKKPNRRSGAPGRTVGEVVDKFEGDGCETACTGTRDSQCVYVPYVLSVSLEFLRAVARVCGVHVSLLRMWCSA